MAKIWRLTLRDGRRIRLTLPTTPAGESDAPGPDKARPPTKDDDKTKDG